jgi:hypothetical protein
VGLILVRRVIGEPAESTDAAEAEAEAAKG